ncbi:hypothetical protein FOA52_008907 [Chlamydomonas sp. UWO 241]|nr:hypothetical protein FOA52_008907 [Chlamydomonas sp. UWO 241]
MRLGASEPLLWLAPTGWEDTSTSNVDRGGSDTQHSVEAWLAHAAYHGCHANCHAGEVEAWLAHAARHGCQAGEVHDGTHGASAACSWSGAPLEEAAQTVPSTAGQQEKDDDDGFPLDPQVSGSTVLIVAPGSAGRWRLLHSMASAGARLVCYGCAPGAAPARLLEYVRPGDWIPGPMDDEAAAEGAARAWLGSQPVGTRLQGLLCYDEFGVELASRLAPRLGLQSSSPDVVACARSKTAFRAACAGAGLPTPNNARLAGPMPPDQLAARLAHLSFPVVAKPESCAGSFCVMRCDDIGEVVDATAAFWDGLPAYVTSCGAGACSSTAHSGMLVEEFIPGHEVDVDCVVVRGQLLFGAVSDNHPCGGSSSGRGGERSFVEAGCMCPSELPTEAQASILRSTAQVVSLFGPSLSGVLHFEAIWDGARGRCTPVELNMRVGGAETWSNVRAAWGIDLARCALRISLGLPPRLPRHLARAHADSGRGRHAGATPPVPTPAPAPAPATSSSPQCGRAAPKRPPVPAAPAPLQRGAALPDAAPCASAVAAALVSPALPALVTGNKLTQCGQLAAPLAAPSASVLSSALSSAAALHPHGDAVVGAEGGGGEHEGARAQAARIVAEHVRIALVHPPFGVL